MLRTWDDAPDLFKSFTIVYKTQSSVAKWSRGANLFSLINQTLNIRVEMVFVFFSKAFIFPFFTRSMDKHPWMKDNPLYGLSDEELEKRFGEDIAKWKSENE